jgi:hypothetical protein
MGVMRTKAWRKKRGEWFDDVIRRADQDRKKLLDKLKDVREEYYREPGGFSNDKDGPWENSSDIHIPLIMEKVEGGVPKVLSAMWRANPFVNVRRAGGSSFSLERVKNVENYLSWAFHNDIPNFHKEFENFLRNMMIDGTSFGKVRWERKDRRVVESFTLDMYEGEGDERVSRSPIDMLTEIFGLGDVQQTLYGQEQIDSSTFSVMFTEGGRKYEGVVEFYESEFVDKIEARVFRSVIEHESPTFEIVEIEDIVFPFRSKCLQSATWVAHKTWYSYKEIEDLVKSKNWHLTKKQLEILKNHARVAEEANEHEEMKDDVIGEETSTSRQNPSYGDKKINPNKIIVWEVYTNDVVDGDPEPIPVVHFVPEIVRTVASTEYMDELLPHGRRPFVYENYIRIPGRVFGMGMAEVLYGINLSLDHTINTINDSMTITTNPMFTYSPMAMAMTGGQGFKIEPGVGIPLADPNAINFPNWGQQPLEGYHATFSQMRGIADSLTFSPSVMGNTNYRNAPRTAAGTQMVMNAAEEQLSYIVERMQSGSWKELVEQVASLYGKYTTIDKWYTVTGETEARKVSPKELRQNFLFEFSGSLTSVNRDIQRSMVERLYSMLSQDPMYQQDPEAKRALMRTLAEKFIESTDVSTIIPAAPGTAGFPHPNWSQDQENRSMAQGEHVAVLPNDDHMQHIKELEKFMQTDAFLILPDMVKGLYYAHKKEHEAVMQQQMQQGERVAAGGGTPAAQEFAAGMAPEPGIPVEGVPAPGGELSFQNGGV